MKALVMTAFKGPLTVEDVPDPACPPDGAIVEVRACGVCRSDHHAWSGVDPDVRLPHVPGHEFAGVVVETGRETSRVPVGAAVTAPFILACGRCGDCRSGRETVCADQQVIGFSAPGAFAERVAVPRADFNLVRLPDALSFVAAASLGCRATTAWRALVDRAAVRPGEWVSVHGCGGVGLSAISIAQAIGARVVAVDVSQPALDFATACGAELALRIDAGSDPAAVGAQVRAATGGGAHVAVEAVGLTASFEAALQALRPLGRMVQVGMPVGRHARPALPLLDLIYARQLTLHGMRGLGAPAFAPMLDLVAAGRLPLDRLVGDRIGLEGVGAALAAMDGAQPPGVVVAELGAV